MVPADLQQEALEVGARLTERERMLGEQIPEGAEAPAAAGAVEQHRETRTIEQMQVLGSLELPAQSVRREGGAEVEKRSGGGRGRDTAMEPDVPRPELPRVVSVEAAGRSLRGRWKAHVNRPQPAGRIETLMLCGAGVAQGGRGSSRENCGHQPALPADVRMPDRIDAAVEAMKVAGSDPASDR